MSGNQRADNVTTFRINAGMVGAKAKDQDQDNDEDRKGEVVAR